MIELTRHDVVWAVRRLPPIVVDLLKKHSGRLFMAGGFLRACIAGERISDVDLFGPSKQYLEAVAKSTAKTEAKCIVTDNALTVLGYRMPIQFIHRWTYTSAESLVRSFDFTICAAALWIQDGRWCSLAHPDFYADLAGKRLVYLSPERNEDAGGSLLRVLKFYQRGYRIPLDSLASVVARLISVLDPKTMVRGGAFDEEYIAKILTGLLREVDPSIDPEHIAHLPALVSETEKPGVVGPGEEASDGEASD